MLSPALVVAVAKLLPFFQVKFIPSLYCNGFPTSSYVIVCPSYDVSKSFQFESLYLHVTVSTGSVDIVPVV